MFLQFILQLIAYWKLKFQKFCQKCVSIIDQMTVQLMGFGITENLSSQHSFENNEFSSKNFILIRQLGSNLKSLATGRVAY